MRLRRLEPVLRRALRGPCRLPRGSRLLVAASGGADSTALLVALASLAHEFDLELAAAHLNHGLRASAADLDAEHVRALCARLRVPLESARWDTRARMRNAGLTGEAGLRVLRRRFLVAAARRAGAVAIATAHTADDQLETVLMRLARGTSLAGLGGMRPRHGPWLKPLLGATRHDIERDLAAARLPWREDASNRERDAFRNRVRLDVVPALLRALAPGEGRPAARAGLALRVARAAQDARGGAALAARWAARALVRHGNGAGLDARALAHVAPTLQAATLRALWRRAGPGTCGLTGRHVEALRRLLGGRDGGSVTLPEGWHARRTAGRVELHPPRPGRGIARPGRA